MTQKKPKKKPKKKTPTDSDKSGKIKETERQIFMRFIALPRLLRIQEFGYKTLKDFAKKNKVSPDTLTDWQKEDGFWDEVRKLWKEWGRGRTPDVILGLYRKAVKDGNASEALAWFKLIEDWQEKQTIDIKSEDLKKMRQDMRKIAESIKDQKK